MVRYTCSRCKRVFTKKFEYNRHINRIIKCTVRDKAPEQNLVFQCKCGKCYSRKDTLKQHIDEVHKGDVSYIHEEIINNGKIQNNGNKNTNGNKNITGNKNTIQRDIINITINYNNMAPFGKDGTDFLTFEEKMRIFSNSFNPLEAIILMVNLDDNRYDHHNVGVPDMKLGYGIIYDGKEWISEKISEIMDVLIESKEKDLINIYNDIKCVLSEKDNAYITEGVNSCKMIRTDPQSRKSFISHIKKHLYNKRQLALNARKTMKQHKANEAAKLHNIRRQLTFKDNLNFKQAEEIYNKNLENKKYVQIQKDMLLSILDIYNEKHMISQEEITDVKKFISDVNNIELMKKIIDIVIKKTFDGYQLTTQLLTNELANIEQIHIQKEMINLIIDMYSNKNIITSDDKISINDLITEINDPKDVKKIFDIVIRRMFENYNLMNELFSCSYTRNNVSDEDTVEEI